MNEEINHNESMNGLKLYNLRFDTGLPTKGEKTALR